MKDGKTAVANMVRKEKHDWEAIEREFRAGVLSIREIANQHECSDTAIRKRMNKLGIERDLSKRVKEKVRTELVRAEVRTANPLTEKEIVEHAAATQVDVVRSHRKRIGETSEVVTTLIGQLRDVASDRTEIEEVIVRETADDPQRRAQMLKAVSLPTHAVTANNLVNALKSLVAMERQAFSIDDAPPQQSSIDEVLSAVAKARRPLVVESDDQQD